MATSSDAAAAPAEEAPEDLNWKVIAMMYAAGSVLCFILLALHAWPSVADDGKVEKYFPSVRGFWLIFSPFPACLAYAIYRWRGQAAARLSTKKER